jgi:two-component system, LytTR family, response regulator
MLRVALVDDEALARKALRQRLARHPEVSIVGEAATVGEAERLTQELKPDVLFLDIGLPDAEGFALLGRADPPPKIVFVTAHSGHALRAFEVGAADYLLKPVKAERLAACLARLTETGAPRPAAPAPATADRLLNLRTPARSVVTPVRNIVALQAEGDFTRVLLAEQAPLLICRTLGSFARELPEPPFARLGRSLIVNAERLRSVETAGRSGTVVSLLGVAEPLRLGKTAARRLRLLQARLGR